MPSLTGVSVNDCGVYQFEVVNVIEAVDNVNFESLLANVTVTSAEGGELKETPNFKVIEPFTKGLEDGSPYRIIVLLITKDNH